MVRAQKEAALLALKALGQETVSFLASMPKGQSSQLIGEDQKEAVAETVFGPPDDYSKDEETSSP